MVDEDDKRVMNLKKEEKKLTVSIFCNTKISLIIDKKFRARLL